MEFKRHKIYLEESLFAIRSDQPLYAAAEIILQHELFSRVLKDLHFVRSFFCSVHTDASPQGELTVCVL